MCGRFSVNRIERLSSAYPQYRFPAVQPRFNIAPSTPILVKRNDDGNEVVFMRWGLVPSFAADPRIGNKMINARSETIAERPSFRNAFRKRRCLVFATSFYEWHTTPAGKQPILFRMRSDEPFVFAGLYERWWGAKESKLDDPIETATIITTQPNDLVARVHNRMPVILPPAAQQRWLDPQFDTVAAMADLVPYPADQMEAFVVDRRVNNASFDDPICTIPITAFAVV
jgi:putative SOS response-associated peptidase YedK